MPHESAFRDSHGRMKLPVVGIPAMIHSTRLCMSPQEESSFENMMLFIYTMVTLTGRLRRCLSGYKTESWVDVPFHELFVDAQAAVLFLRQFMEDAAVVIHTALPVQVRGQMSTGFAKLTPRIIGAGPGRDSGLDAVCPATDQLRTFLVAEQAWFSELKDLRDDISHRTPHGRVRSSQFPGFMDLMLSGGGHAPFASEIDLRTYLCGLFQRWLALANLVSEFVLRRARAEHPDRVLPMLGGVMIAPEEEAAALTLPLGTAVLTLPAEDMASLEYFLGGV